MADGKHFVGCHSYSHKRLSDDLSSETLSTEIDYACELFFQKSNHKYRAFTWVGGEEYSYGRNAFNLLKKRNLDFIFATNCEPILKHSNKNNLNRFAADAKFSLNQTRFAISMAYTFMYFPKRRRLRKNIGLN